MAKGYWLVAIEVSDLERYANYTDQVRPFLARIGARFLTRGGAHEIVEGTGLPRNVIIEFDTYAAAVDAYNSAEYQAMIPIRAAASTGNFIIVEGFD